MDFKTALDISLPIAALILMLVNAVFLFLITKNLIMGFEIERLKKTFYWYLITLTLKNILILLIKKYVE